MTWLRNLAIDHSKDLWRSILRVQSPWRSSVIKYMTISHRDCTLFFQGRSLEIVLQFLKYQLWEIVPSKIVTISGDRFGRSLPFSGYISYLEETTVLVAPILIGIDNIPSPPHYNQLSFSKLQTTV